MGELPSVFLHEIQFTWDPRLLQLRIVRPCDILIFIDAPEARQLKDFLTKQLDSGLV